MMLYPVSVGIMRMHNRCEACAEFDTQVIQKI